MTHSLLFGANVKSETLDSDAFAGTKTAMTASAFVQDIWNIGGADTFRITPGLRLNMFVPQEEGEDPLFNVTPKLAMRFDPAASLTLRLSYGMGFKTPTLKQTYWVFFHPSPYNFLIMGNPDLKPESSQGVNASAEWKPLEGLTLSAGAYFNNVFDMIEAEEVPGSDNGGAGGTAAGADGVVQHYIYIMKYRNIGRAVTAGADISLRWQTSRFTGSLSYNYGLAKEWSGGAYRDIGSRVPHQVSAQARYMIPAVETAVSLRAAWNAPQTSSAAAQMGSSAGTRGPDFLMAAAQVSKTLFKDRLEIYAGVKNLLNNLHFIKGSAGETQEDYYGLRDGAIFYLGGTFTL
jgi:outer membrane receptor for ferrienterochelin and colicins